MTIRNLFQLSPIPGSSFTAILIGLAIATSPALADNYLIGGILACGAKYKSSSTSEAQNVASWKFSNFNKDPIFIKRISVYDWDGSLFSDYKWNGSGFEQLITGTGAGSILPSDENETIDSNDNKLSAFQPFQYSSNVLSEAMVLPEHLGGRHVTLVVKWKSDGKLVYPLVGGVTRISGGIAIEESFAALGRSDHPCKMIKANR